MQTSWEHPGVEDNGLLEHDNRHVEVGRLAGLVLRVEDEALQLVDVVVAVRLQVHHRHRAHGDGGARDLQAKGFS